MSEVIIASNTTIKVGGGSTISGSNTTVGSVTMFSTTVNQYALAIIKLDSTAVSFSGPVNNVSFLTISGVTFMNSIGSPLTTPISTGYVEVIVPPSSSLTVSNAGSVADAVSKTWVCTYTIFQNSP
jgi:hypothetical protein